MSDYVAPVKDMRFVLEEVLGVGELAKFPAFADIDFEVLADLLSEAGRFFSEVLAPTNRTGDQQGSRRNADGSVTTPDGFRDAYARYIDGGWGAMSFDPEFGGGGFPWVIGLAVQEMMTAANMAFSLCPMLTQGSIHLLSAHGSKEQQHAWLPQLISGRWTGSMNLTEPQAGSDVGALSTRAERQADGSYRIFGQKIFITWGEHDLTDNIVHLVLARTPDAPLGTKGISCFVVPKLLVNADGSLGEANDVTCLSIEHKMGIHASPTCVLSFGDRGDGAVAELIGEEQAGMRYMFTMMNQARLAVGLEGVALADRAYQLARSHAAERQQGRRPDTPRRQQAFIIEHPDVRRMLATMRCQIEALRCLVYLNAVSIDRAQHGADEEERIWAQELTELLTPLSKGWGTDLGIELTSIGVQVHGGMGYVEEAGAAQHYRDIRIAAIYEGTNGIQALDLVGRKLPMRDGAVLAELIEEMGATVAALRQADLADIADRLEAAMADTRAAATWLLAKGAGGTDDGLAGATPFLRLLATTVGGWLLGRSALVAQRKLAEDKLTEPKVADYDKAFLTDKISTARFYASQILPQVQGLLPAVTAGAAQLYAVPVS